MATPLPDGDTAGNSVVQAELESTEGVVQLIVVALQSSAAEFSPVGLWGIFLVGRGGASLGCRLLLNTRRGQHLRQLLMQVMRLVHHHLHTLAMLMQCALFHW